MGHPSSFQRVSRLASVTARQSSIGCQPNFAAFNRGRHLYSAGRPSRWALAHILVYSKLLFIARSELRKVLFLALSVTFLFVPQISREPLNGFASNSQEDVFGTLLERV